MMRQARIEFFQGRFDGGSKAFICERAKRSPTDRESKAHAPEVKEECGIGDDGKREG
jgi:hypothetical protein